MRVVAFVNNRVGAEVAEILTRSPSTELVGLVVHPPEHANQRSEILATAGLEPERVLDGSRLDTEDSQRRLRELKPEAGVAAYFGYILRQPVLDLFPHGVFNLHPALLPYNRGSFPNVWSLVEGTPAGVTMHQMDEGIDTGPIVAQREVEKRPTDTGESLYRRLEQASVSLFSETWPSIERGEHRLTAQDDARATTHRTGDVEAIDEIDLEGTYRARELLDRIRARTFSGHDGCYFLHEGRKIHLDLYLRDSEASIEDDDETD